MTASRALLASLSTVLTVALGSFSSISAPAIHGGTSAAPAAPRVQLAQNVDPKDQNVDPKDKKAEAAAKKAAAKAAREEKIKAAKENASKKKQENQAAREQALKAKQQQVQQAKEKALKQKQDTQAAREQALKAKQQQAQQAKEKAFKQKQDTQAAREKAFKDKQLQAQQAKENALKQKQDAQAAREKALKDKQLQFQQAKEKALKDKQDAAAAREKAVRDKQLEAQQAKDKAIKDKQDAAAAREKAIRDKLEASKTPRGAGKFDRAKVDTEFDRARKQAQEQRGQRAEKWQAAKASKFEALRKGRTSREAGSRDLVIEPDKRVIVRDKGRTYIRHDDSSRFRKAREIKRERRKDGTWLIVTAGLAGALIYALQDDEGRVIRRSRRDRDGREFVLFDDRRSYHGDAYDVRYVDLPPPVVSIPRDRYIVEYDSASPDDIYEALDAPPIEDMGDGYSLDEVRQNYGILERMRRVDLSTVNFDFASWDVDPSEYPKLENMARAIQRILDRSPTELFLIEGHTDAVGSEIDNLSLSDRRAETVAAVLSDEFGIPPENLTTQGYGEEHLKELTDGPSWINRRVGVRRITPLLSRKGWDDGY
ncbi:MAG: OmpA family protein [Hyphomicrobium sp.]|uniref:OmpA family protein n=1 Tax=Hyphomicrobium sp. TaxID=82 RepID=UPI003D0E8D8C